MITIADPPPSGMIMIKYSMVIFCPLPYGILDPLITKVLAKFYPLGTPTHL